MTQSFKDLFRKGMEIQEATTPSMAMGEFVGKCKDLMGMVAWQLPDSYPVHLKPPVISPISVDALFGHVLTPETIEGVHDLQRLHELNLEKLLEELKLSSNYPTSPVPYGDLALSSVIIRPSMKGLRLSTTVQFAESPHQRFSLALGTPF